MTRIERVDVVMNRIVRAKELPEFGRMPGFQIRVMGAERMLMAGNIDSAERFIASAENFHLREELIQKAQLVVGQPDTYRAVMIMINDDRLDLAIEALIEYM